MAASIQSPLSPTSEDPAVATLTEQFKAFAKFGDSKSTGDAITLSNSDKWMKQAKVIDGKTITTVDTGIYFKQVAKTKKAISVKEYRQYLQTLAKNKKVEYDEIRSKMTGCGTPGTTGTTSIIKSAAVDRLTDTTKYTGTHKQRFDETGKGRGKEGREDVHANKGYVQGYKQADTYDEKVKESE